MKKRRTQRIARAVLAALLLLAAPAAAEQQVVFTDVLIAYDEGRVDDARTLAAAHLERFRATMNDPQGPFDVESGVRSSLALIRSVLEAENRLPAPARLAGQPDLRADVDAALLEAHARAAPLRGRSEPMRTYIDREFGITAAEWIRAREAQAPRGELDATFEEFRGELQQHGFPSVDAAISGRRVPSLDGS